MIGTLLANIGLPMLIKTVKGALGKIDNKVAQTASKALDEVSIAVEKKEISPEELKEANRHAETMKELETKENIKALEQINETFRHETKSEDKYVRRWRPTFGYAVALSWLLMMLSVAYSIIMTPEKAPSIITTLVNCSTLWTVALGVLGVSVVKRSQDKKITNRNNPTT